MNKRMIVFIEPKIKTLFKMKQVLIAIEGSIIKNIRVISIAVKLEIIAPIMERVKIAIKKI